MLPNSHKRTFQFLVWLTAVFGTANVFAQQYPFIPVAGAPKNIKTMFQDSKGRLWLGGEQLNCFDGTRFFDLHEDGFASAPSYDITEDSSGAIWIAAQTGVYRFFEGHLEQVATGVSTSVIAATPDVVVASVGPDGPGIPDRASLVRITRTAKAWVEERVLDLGSAAPLTLDHAGLLLYPWPGKGWKEVKLRDVITWTPHVALSVTGMAAPEAAMAGPMKVLRDRFGCVWRNDGDVYRCGDNTWRNVQFPGASLNASFREGRNGSMLLLGYSFLAIGRPGAFHTVSAENGLPQIFTAIEATDGSIWLGGAQGLYRFASPFRMEYWTAKEGVDNPWCFQKIGAKIFAGLNRTVAILSNNRRQWNRLTSFAKIGQVVGLLPTANGGLMAALNPGVAAQLSADGRVVAQVFGRDSLDYGLRLAHTPNHDVWLGGIFLSRVLRKGSQLKIEKHHLGVKNFMAGNVLDVQYEAGTHKLWACFNGGLLGRDEDGKWRQLTRKDGLLVDACWSLAALPNGDVWYGYYNTAAFALVRPTPNGKFAVTQFRSGDGIP